MAMLGAKPEPSAIADSKLYYATADALYRRGAYAEAHGLLKRLVNTEPQAVAPKVSLALCHIAAEDYHVALELLDRALTLTKGLGEALQPEDEVAKRLRAAAYESCDHMVPLPYDLPAELMPYAKRIILRLQLDTCVKLGLSDRVQTLAAQFPAHAHKHIDDARASAGA